MKKEYKTYIIPDLHEKILWLPKFIESLNDDYDEIVLLGDYFDSFDSTKESVENTCNFIKTYIYKPKFVFIFGNHDMWPAFPQCNEFICSGNNLEKSKFINTILKRKDWNKLVLYHKTQNWYLSHAGLHKHHFEHPINGFTDEWIKNSCDKALEQAKHGIANPILKAGWARGGNQVVGGIDWLCWSEFEPIPNINQIVGHTQGSDVRYMYCPNKKNANSVNVCLDVNLRYIGKLIDGKFSVIENPILGNI